MSFGRMPADMQGRAGRGQSSSDASPPEYNQSAQANKSKASHITDDAVLGGRLHLRQLRDGHRVGHDAILLAAACPARAGEHAVELGAGVGAAGLALASRVEGLTLTLVEVDGCLADLARENAQSNGLSKRVHVVKLDVLAGPRVFAAAGLAAESFTRVLMNPPFNDRTRHRLSADSRRRLAHAASGHALPAWIKTASWLLRPSGTLTMIWRADSLDKLLQAISGAFGGPMVLPVHSRPGEPAIRVLVRATKASRTPLCLLPGLFLNGSDGRPSVEAEAVLRNGSTLPLAEL
jgi:tRNA1(Val) A37 N6-methylase TrmN6